MTNQEKCPRCGMPHPLETIPVENPIISANDHHVNIHGSCGSLLGAFTAICYGFIQMMGKDQAAQFINAAAMSALSNGEASVVVKDLDRVNQAMQNEQNESINNPQNNDPTEPSSGFLPGSSGASS